MSTIRTLSTCLLSSAVTTLAATLTFGAPGSDSGDETIELATLEVTAHPSGAEERPAAVWVLRNDLTAAATNAAGLLQGMPGFQLDRAGGPGGRSTLYVRGGEENHTLVLLDGVPLNDPTNSRGGGVDFSLLEPQAVGAVAMVRGPGSMRHGPEALSGVMHLDTVVRGASGHVAALEAGGDELLRARFRSVLTIGTDGDAVSLGGAWHTEEAENGAGELNRVFLHGSYRHAGPIELDLRAWRLDQDSSAFSDDSGGVRHAVIRELERRDDRQAGASLRVGRRDEAGGWQLTADAARLEAHTVSPGVAPGLRDPAGLPAITDDIRLERYRIGTLVERNVADWLLSAGVDAAREDGRDVAVLDFGFMQLPAGFSLSRDRLGAFVEGTGPVTDWLTVSTGLRADRFEGLGTHATGRFGLLGMINENTAWRANAGTAFKAPSFYGMAHPLVGNPDLRPERGRSADVGIRHTFAQGKGLLDFSLFAGELRNGVDFDPGPPPRVANVAEIHSRGAELAGLWRLRRDLALSGSLTYTDARAKPGDTRLRSRPHWRGTLALAWTPVSWLALDARLTAIDEVPDSSIPTGDVMLGGWARADLAARWIVDEHWSVTVACDNVLGREYEEVVGFVAPGRRGRLGVQFRF